MGKLIDLTGQRFGRLTVIERAENSPNGTAVWHCVCDCGNVAVVRRDRLCNGKTRSCGCLAKEIRRDIHTTHGMSDTRLHKIWSGLKERCNNPNNQFYDRYGGRGITVCDEWQADFCAFYNWAMDNGYADDLSIDRIDNDKGYSPDNCRWATQKQQNNNLSTNRRITINGETQNLSKWCEKMGIKKTTVAGRLKAGWTVEEVLELIPRKKS